MSQLVVLAFDDANGAAAMLQTVHGLQKANLIQVEDAATVTRKPDGKAKVKQANSLVGAGAMGGAFWGMLIGLLFFAPWLGLAVGAITGALGGKMSDVGIDDGFIKDVSQSIPPGGSGLFLLVRSAVEDKVLPELTKYKAKVLRTSLSSEQEAKLKAAFGAEE